MIPGESTATRRLREQVEQALATSQSRKVIEPLLERLVSIAPAASEAAVLGHRYLAEYRLQEHPWRALLHLKQVIAVHPDDDVAHAMSGLAHAMSANYRAAVASYRAATLAAPENPWYHHNLGHILDVALDRASAALPHLRTAYEILGAEEPEVTASIVHCLSQLGAPQKLEAIAILQVARKRHPKHTSLAELAKQLDAPDLVPSKRQPAKRAAALAMPAPIPLRPRVSTATVSTDAAPASPSTTRLPSASSGADAPHTKPSMLPAAGRSGSEADDDPVLAALRARLGAQPTRFDTARKIWTRYCATQRDVRRGRPRNTDILAAAVHRIVMRRAAGKVTLASIARAYGVDPKAVAARCEEIERVLEG